MNNCFNCSHCVYNDNEEFICIASEDKKVVLKNDEKTSDFCWCDEVEWESFE